MNAPKKPTVVPINPQHDKYIIQFAPELTSFIKKDGKVKTYRYGEKYSYLKVKDKVRLQEYNTGNFIANAFITGIERTIFKDLPLNISGHETYETKDHQRKVFSSYFKYIGREIEDNDPFLVITFDLV